MSKDELDQLRDEGLAFFGRITAGQSHELVNVLNIINEVAGLQKDLFAVTKQGGLPDLVKLEACADKIMHQVQRGEKIIRYINRFAHNTDHPIDCFDLREAMDRVAFLAQRSAHLKQTELIIDLPDESILLETSPFWLQQSCFVAIEIALLGIVQDRCIRFTYEIETDQVSICICSANPLSYSPEAEAKMALLKLLVNELEGELRILSNPPDGSTINLLLARTV